MTAYYNEIDPYAAQWLRNLISAGHIAPGDVDERSIVDVRADDLRGYTQCHFFAGIGGWSVALRIAGWPDDRLVWTGSCPCQPFSAAGAGKAADDERHLWPAWFPLIAECRPPIIFGEQVEAAIGWGWIDAVFSDLEGQSYACGATVLPACGIGAPHVRNRLWFVADADGGHAGTEGLQRSRKQRQQPADSGPLRVANTGRRSLQRECRPGEAHGPARPAEGEAQQREWRGPHYGDSGTACELANSTSGGQRELGNASQPRRGRYADRSGLSDFWFDAEWIECTDGRTRPIGPDAFPLGHGIRNRTSKLRAYGNAIVPQIAAEFIRAASA